MGVTWGIEVGTSSCTERQEFVDTWTLFAQVAPCKRFTVLFDNDRYDFTCGKASATHAVSSAPELAAQIAAIPTSDGTYDIFERLLDGQELFLPGSRKPFRFKAPNTKWDGKLGAGTKWLNRAMEIHRYYLSNPRDDWYAEMAKDPWLVKLVEEILGATHLAIKHNLLVGVGF